MTTNEVIALLLTPVGGLVVGLFAYWLATRRSDKPAK